MHPVDCDEFLANLGELGRQAELLLADPALAEHSGTLHRIILILAYMREHLEMLKPSEKGTARETPGAFDASISGLDFFAPR